LYLKILSVFLNKYCIHFLILVNCEKDENIYWGKIMTRGEILKDFFMKTLFPALIILVLFVMAKALFTDSNGTTDYFYVWIFCGIPFGIWRVRVWLIPRNFDLGTTVAILAIGFIISGLIGGFVVIWKLLLAIWYLAVTIQRFIIYRRGNNAPVVSVDTQE